MNNNSLAQNRTVTKVAFWGICLVAIAWLTFTMLFEMHRGVPSNGIQWTKRLAGWIVEGWFLHTLISGIRRTSAGTV